MRNRSVGSVEDRSGGEGEDEWARGEIGVGVGEDRGGGSGEDRRRCRGG